MRRLLLSLSLMTAFFVGGCHKNETKTGNTNEELSDNTGNTLESSTPVIALPPQTVVVDLSQAAQEGAAKFGNVPVTTVANVPHKDYVCKPSYIARGYGPDQNCYNITTYSDVPSTSQQPLSVSNVRIVSYADPIYGTGSETAVPKDMMIIGETAVNCTKQKATAQITLSKQTQHQESVTLTHSVQHSQNFNLSLTAGGTFAKVTAGVTIGSQETNTTASLVGTTDSGLLQGNGSITLEPNEKIYAQLEVVPQTFSIPFHTSVVIDGNLSANDKYKLYSEIVPNVGDRTYPLDGTLSTTAAVGATLVFLEAPFNPAECRSATGVVYSTGVPVDTSKLKKVKTQTLTPSGWAKTMAALRGS